MAAFDFNNDRGKNLADPKFDKDAVNLRSARVLFRDFTGNTSVGGNVFLRVDGGTGGPYTFTGNTTVSDLFATDIDTGVINSLIIRSGGTNLTTLFVHSVQGGTNIKITGATIDPVVNLEDNINLISLSATTYFSGSTDLSDLFGDGNVSSAGLTEDTVTAGGSSGSQVKDGTWAFSGNTIYPLTDSSNIGLSGTNRVDTIFMTSRLDYSSGFRVTTGATTAITVNNLAQVGVGVPNPTAKMHIRGTGDTSSSFALQVEDSGSTFSFGVRDDGRIGIGASVGFAARLQVRGESTTSSTFGFRVDDGNGAAIFRVRDDSNIFSKSILPLNSSNYKIGSTTTGEQFDEINGTKIRAGNTTITAFRDAGDGRTPGFSSQVAGITNNVNEVHFQHSNTSTDTPEMAFARARGTQASRTIVVSGDTTGTLKFAGYDGTDYIPTSTIVSEVDNNVIVATNNVAGVLKFKVNTGSASVSDAMIIDSNLNVGIGTLTATTRLDVRGGVSGTTMTATTYNALTGVKFLEPSSTPPPETGLMWFSGGTMFVYSAGTAADLVSLY